MGYWNDARKLEPDALPLMVERFAFLVGDKGLHCSGGAQPQDGG